VPPPIRAGALEPRWLGWGRRIQALAQTGLTFTQDAFDRERYGELRALAAEMMALAGDDPVSLLEDFERELGYATPKVGVRGAVFRDDTILLVRDRLSGLWAPPGGWADVNESPSEAVTREVLEEAGVRTRAVKLIAVYDSRRRGAPQRQHVYRLFFRCVPDDTPPDAPNERSPERERPASELEIDAVDYFTEHNLPPMVGSVPPDVVARLFVHARNPDFPTEFD